MQTIKVVAALLIVVASIVAFAGAQIYVSTVPIRIPGVKRITQWELTPEEMNAECQTTEYYAKFQMVIDESRLADFGASASSVEHSGSKTCDKVIVRFVETGPDGKKTEFVFECHRCYMNGDVSGGGVVAIRGSERWELGFMQVGDHGVIFTNTRPPEWVLEKSSDVVRAGISEEFLQRFKEIYWAESEGNTGTKHRVSGEIIGMLIRLIDMEFGFTNGHSKIDT